ncbi:hypothetical protein LGN17_24350 [Burkholderia sp. AU30280]|uniref:hypothetical protein n=1 Tax=Burkholderia sp. AU30280 TaxID=2879628 RepID=UPI001CF52C61|nr:hypothetical protein [Burkholderia sp. AU30280]MCA8275619.1 hypothetical protein [Burkholderia sp. AU30280]
MRGASGSARGAPHGRARRGAFVGAGRIEQYDKKAIEIRAYEASDLHTLSAIWFDVLLLAHPFFGDARLREQRTPLEAVYLPEAETWGACRAADAISTTPYRSDPSPVAQAPSCTRGAP